MKPFIYALIAAPFIYMAGVILTEYLRRRKYIRTMK